jgi:hypothetical protein
MTEARVFLVSLAAVLAGAALGGCGGSGDTSVAPGTTNGGTAGAATAGTGGQGGAVGKGGAASAGKGGASTGGAAGTAGKGGAAAGTGGKAGNGGSAGGAAGTAGSGAASGSAGASIGVGGGGGSAGSGGATGGSGAGATSGAGGSISAACVPFACPAPGNPIYQCGDCIDNDGDGLVDMDDPDCQGPCGNSEAAFTPPPGSINPPCKQTCFFDKSSGAGMSGCVWSHKCDPHEIAPDFSPEAGCNYDPKAKVPGANGQSCAQLNTTQAQMCLDTCGPLTPNGCDCFGCCYFDKAVSATNPTGTVWLGSQDTAGVQTCAADAVADPTKCHPCLTVAGCYKPCAKCELCLGKTTLPPECTGGAGGNAGGAGSGGGGGDPAGGGAGSGGAPPVCGGQVCAAGVQACGATVVDPGTGLPVDCQPPCPNGQFCLTGCCTTGKP